MIFIIFKKNLITILYLSKTKSIYLFIFFFESPIVKQDI